MDSIEKELNSMAIEILSLEKTFTQPPTLTNKLEQIKFGLSVKNLSSLKDGFFRFYKFGNSALLIEEARNLYKNLSKEKEDLNEMLKSLESPSEEILKMLNNGYEK